ncbi:sensor histidine kinase [Streptomyces sp. NPDC057638]|uniref:sensor histidine kinase n=1 Tax=Streptomyces sp. NPDC057638 TaxID=3346190 RepID=UPI00367B3546
METTPPPTRPRLGERVLTAVSRDPLTAPHRLRNDTVGAVLVAALSVLIAHCSGNGRAPDAIGWPLLFAACAVLPWRRSRPLLVLAAVILCTLPYHAMDYTHTGPIPPTLLALYTVAATSRPRHTVLVGCGVVVLVLSIMIGGDPDQGLQLLRVSGWILMVLFIGVDVRIYRRYIASVVARAEHAERTREEEAGRRVAEERLRIARDLHDLLAHSITLIGVRTAVASHILTVDPDKLDRAAVAAALDEIAETCRTARGELRTTLSVLRTDASEDGPLPDLAALPELVRTAHGTLTLRPGAEPLPPAVTAATYRIVQEALTNAVRHGGHGTRITVDVIREGPALHVTVTNDDSGTPTGVTGSGYGLLGMRERARSVGGTVTAGPRDAGGFTVAAVLPARTPREEASP